MAPEGYVNYMASCDFSQTDVPSSCIRDIRYPPGTPCGTNPAASPLRRDCSGRGSCKRFGVKAAQGSRSYMEDTHVTMPTFMALKYGTRLHRKLFHHPVELQLFCVFDGHGGAAVAQHCADTLPKCLYDNIKTQVATQVAETQGLPHSFADQSTSKAACLEACQVGNTNVVHQALDQVVPSAMEAAFQQTDNSLREGTIAAWTGTTAIVAVVGQNTLWVANCGDSRAVLCTAGTTVPLSKDHKPSCPLEADRIAKTGGVVVYNYGRRVMGVLSVSRAIGDHSFQQYGLSAEPEVRSIPRHPEDEFLLLASDGLWEVMSNDDAIQLARRCFLRAKSRGAGPGAAARISANVLTRVALGRGSGDNITVLVVDLTGEDELQAKGSGGELASGYTGNELQPKGSMEGAGGVCEKWVKGNLGSDDGSTGDDVVEGLLRVSGSGAGQVYGASAAADKGQDSEGSDISDEGAFGCEEAAGMTKQVHSCLDICSTSVDVGRQELEIIGASADASQKEDSPWSACVSLQSAGMRPSDDNSLDAHQPCSTAVSGPCCHQWLPRSTSMSPFAQHSGQEAPVCPGDSASCFADSVSVAAVPQRPVCKPTQQTSSGDSSPKPAQQSDSGHSSPHAPECCSPSPFCVGPYSPVALQDAPGTLTSPFHCGPCSSSSTLEDPSAPSSPFYLPPGIESPFELGPCEGVEYMPFSGSIVSVVCPSSPSSISSVTRSFVATPSAAIGALESVGFGYTCRDDACTTSGASTSPHGEDAVTVQQDEGLLHGGQQVDSSWHQAQHANLAQLAQQAQLSNQPQGASQAQLAHQPQLASQPKCATQALLVAQAESANQGELISHSVDYSEVQESTHTMSGALHEGAIGQQQCGTLTKQASASCGWHCVMCSYLQRGFSEPALPSHAQGSRAERSHAQWLHVLRPHGQGVGSQRGCGCHPPMRAASAPPSSPICTSPFWLVQEQRSAQLPPLPPAGTPLQTGPQMCTQAEVHVPLTGAHMSAQAEARVLRTGRQACVQAGAQALPTGAGARARARARLCAEPHAGPRPNPFFAAAQESRQFRTTLMTHSASAPALGIKDGLSQCAYCDLSALEVARSAGEGGVAAAGECAIGEILFGNLKAEGSAVGENAVGASTNWLAWKEDVAGPQYGAGMVEGNAAEEGEMATVVATEGAVVEQQEQSCGHPCGLHLCMLRHDDGGVVCETKSLPTAPEMREAVLREASLEHWLEPRKREVSMHYAVQAELQSSEVQAPEHGPCLGACIVEDGMWSPFELFAPVQEVCFDESLRVAQEQGQQRGERGGKQADAGQMAGRLVEELIKARSIEALAAGCEPNELTAPWGVSNFNQGPPRGSLMLRGASVPLDLPLLVSSHASRPYGGLFRFGSSGTSLVVCAREVEAMASLGDRVGV